MATTNDLIKNREFVHYILLTVNFHADLESERSFRKKRVHSQCIHWQKRIYEDSRLVSRTLIT